MPSSGKEDEKGSGSRRKSSAGSLASIHAEDGKRRKSRSSDDASNTGESVSSKTKRRAGRRKSGDHVSSEALNSSGHRERKGSPKASSRKHHHKEGRRSSLTHRSRSSTESEDSGDTDRHRKKNSHGGASSEDRPKKSEGKSRKSRKDGSKSISSSEGEPKRDEDKSRFDEGSGTFGSDGNADAFFGSSTADESMPFTDAFAGFPTNDNMNNEDTSADAFGSFPNHNSGFGGFNESGFPPPPKTENSASSAFATTSGFDSAFATEPTFENISADKGAVGDFAGFDTFDQTPSFPTQSTFSQPKETNWDKSPLSDMPTISKGSLAVKRRVVFSKRFEGYPVSNSINGNILYVKNDGNGVCIHEVDPRRNYGQVNCVTILSEDLRHKVASKYNLSIHSLTKVLNLQSGLHFANGKTRVRLAAIVNLRVLESKEPLTVILVWRWGYGVPLIGLQYVLTPPSGSDFSYDASSLQVADNLFFLAGASPKGAFIFINKPIVSEAWSANYLGSSAKVSRMIVTTTMKRDDHPYLVVALSDKSLSAWTYRSALGTNAAKDKTTKRYLFPLCRLDCSSVYSSVEPIGFDGDDEAIGKDSMGECTGMDWLPQQEYMTSLMMLAISFQNGFVVFHISLPLVQVADPDSNGFKLLPEPTHTTSLASLPALTPIAAKRWRGVFSKSSVSWLDLGAQADPCLSLLLLGKDGNHARVLIGSLDLPTYQKSGMEENLIIPFRDLVNNLIPKESTGAPLGFLRSCMKGASLYFSDKTLGFISLSSSKSSDFEASLQALSFPITSMPPGISSSGDPLLLDSGNDKDGILYVFKTVQCERRKLRKGGPPFLEWTTPTKRYWICRALPGDAKDTRPEEAKDDGDFGGAEQVLGGASADMICDLNHDSLKGLEPLRLLRCKGTTICAIVYRLPLGGSASLDSSYVAFADTAKKNAVIDVVEGRDIAFLPLDEAKRCQGVILSKDGSSLDFFILNIDAEIERHAKYRPIVGVDSDQDYIDSRRVLVCSEGNYVTLSVVGRRLRDNRVCFLTGELCDITTLGASEWSKLLPNIVTGRSYWLGEQEEIFSTIGLEGDGKGYRNFGLLTSQRAIILSSALDLSAECRTKLSCRNIAPLGSFSFCFMANNQVKYICCLDGPFKTGWVTSLIQQNALGASILALRPDRLLLLNCNSTSRLIELKETPDSFPLPTPSTRPVLLLEPLVANAISVGGKKDQTSQTLRTVIEKFGRKVALITHGEKEGLGQKGAGITPKVFQILAQYGLKHAASWLLTGTVQFDRTANTVVLPPWQPISTKAQGALNSDGILHVLSNGDSYLSDYLKSPDQNIPSTLPRQSDPTCYLSNEYAIDFLKKGKAADALKMFDLSGTESTDSVIVQLTLMLERGSLNQASGVLTSLSGFEESALSRSSSQVKAASALSALALCQKKKREAEMSADQISRWIKPLAPSLQQGMTAKRIRHRILGEKVLREAGDKESSKQDSFWVSPCNESKHVWNDGFRRDKSSLLVLDRIEDWLERRRPIVLGKEGASAIQDRGEKTLADLLNQNDDDSFGGKSLESENDIWVTGVGEGRSDEANLSCYFRFAEGENEDSPWKSEGLVDLSSYQNKATILGDPEIFSLQPSTSSVDEGEPGKVKTLYDLVFEKDGIDLASGLALPAPRGGSLDIGLLHTADRDSRKKCTIEFWYYLPSREDIVTELILIRRTFGDAADDLSKVCMVSDKDCMLWELALRKSGELVFRSCGGSVIVSSQNHDGPESKNEDSRADLVAFERWNHVCLILSSKGLEMTKCDVKLLMKGTEVVTSVVSVVPPDFDAGDLDSETNLNAMMEKSHILLGLNHCAGFRLTELRFWACSRDADDVQTFMYEYLTAAEQKKKFKVKITNKNKKGATLGTKLGLAPPKGMLGAPKAGGLAPPRGLAMKSGGLMPPKSALSPPKASKGSTATEDNGLSLAPPPQNKDLSFQSSPAAAVSEKTKDTSDVQVDNEIKESGESDFLAEKSQTKSKEDNSEAEPEAGGIQIDGLEALMGEETAEDDDVPITLWDTAVALSEQIRASAAAALIRGPPATRHYGGNRGGLPDFSGVERYGVGGIAICGSEKTIVFRDNEDPPALTYPIGASGAVVSDQMDDEGSEFLCCFLAKEKRMVVFELRSRTVVVELQMTTKLNFWRYLPPEAAENTLCFMLVTPVGGFHWMPLEESPRPHQVWKRGTNLQGKKIVSYEEGGSNGLDDAEILSKVGLVMATSSSGGGFLEAWIVPISGDSQAKQISDNVMGACLCQPLLFDEGDGAFLPLLVTVHNMDDEVYVNLMSVMEPRPGSLELGDIIANEEIDISEYEAEFDPPSLAMGTYPEALCVSLANIIVVIVRRKGVIAAFEQEEDELNLIAQECVDHYVIDAVMRYSAEVGGAEIVMLLSDDQNLKDGRIVSFCFRSAA